MTTKATFCPHCGEDVPESEESFCQHCGANLIALAVDVRCPSCDQLIQDIDIYCRHCGFFVSSIG